MAAVRFQEPLNFEAHIMLDCQQHDIGAFGPAIGDRPLDFDHTSDAAEMLDELCSFRIRRMYDMNAQAPQITKNLDSHFHFSVTGCS
jgi:hypothetical protein